MATISWARTRFREVSGRDDLTTAKIDEYLNSGQRFLDKVTDFKKSPTRLQSSLAAGEFFVKFTAQMRTLLGVWAAESGDEKWELNKLSEDYLRSLYPEPPSSTTQGPPEHYCSDPMTYYNASGDFEYYDGAYADSFSYSGLIIMPPADGAYLVEVRGRFYSPTLSDTQSSWWLTNHGEMLVLASMRQVEVHYRNTAGRKDWEAALALPLKAIEDDAAEEDIPTPSRMEG